MSLRQRLLNGGRAYGPILMSDSPVVAELMASAGYDFAMVDHEHAPTDARSGQRLLQAMDAAAAFTSGQDRRRTEPLVRVPHGASVRLRMQRHKCAQKA